MPAMAVSNRSIATRAGRAVAAGIADLRIAPAGLVAAVIGAVPSPREIELVSWLADGPVHTSTSWRSPDETRAAGRLRPTAPGTVLGRYRDAGLAHRVAPSAPYTATPRCRSLAQRIAALREGRRSDAWMSTATGETAR